MNDDFEVKMSPLSQRIEQQGKEVDVQIFEDGEGGWLLEVVDEFDNSTVWNESLATDQDAMAALQKTLRDEGIDALIGQPGDA